MKKYTQEGIPVVSRKTLEYLSKKYPGLFPRSIDVHKLQDSIKGLDSSLAQDLFLYLRKENPVLGMWGSKFYAQLKMDDSAQGTPTQGLEVFVGMGFFETYRCLRKQGKKERQNDPNFKGIPILDIETFEESKIELERGVEEQDGFLIAGVPESNPLLYHCGDVLLKHPSISRMSSGESYFLGFLPVIMLLREEQKKRQKKY